MPLDHIARRYADQKHNERVEEVSEELRNETATMQNAAAAKGGLLSGNTLRQYSNLLLNHMNQLAQSRLDTLREAYERSGVSFGPLVKTEIEHEISDYCASLSRNAAMAMTNKVGQFFGPQHPEGAKQAAVNGVVSGGDRILHKILRKLSIESDGLLLDEMKAKKTYAAGLTKKWDVFISHASEDKKEFVTDFANELGRSGLSVWYDQSVLTFGDSFRSAIDEGLLNSRYGVVVLSPHFFKKTWTQAELDGLMGKEIAGVKVIIPILHNMTPEELKQLSPVLAGRLAGISSDGIPQMVLGVRRAMGL